MTPQLPGGIPQLPRGPGSVPGPKQYGQITAPTTPAFGAQAIATGINAFSENYREAQHQKRLKAQQDVENALRLQSLGVHIDQNKLAKDMKAAGIPVDLEGPSSKEMQEAAAQAQSSPLAQMLSFASTMGPTTTGPAPYGPPPYSGAGPVQYPSIEERGANMAAGGQVGFGQVPGMTPMPMQMPTGMPPPGMSPGALSPTVQSLQIMANQAGQQRQLQYQKSQLEAAKVQEEFGNMQLKQDALAGKPGALMQAIRAGVLQGQPSDFIRQIGLQSGLSAQEVDQAIFRNATGWAQSEQNEMAMISKIAEYTSPRGDFIAARQYLKDLRAGKPSDVKLGFSLEDEKRMSDEYFSFAKIFDQASPFTIQEMVLEKAVGGEKWKDKLRILSETSPTAGMTSQARWQREQSLAEGKLEVDWWKAVKDLEMRAKQQNLNEREFAFQKDQFNKNISFKILDKMTEADKTQLMATLDIYRTQKQKGMSEEAEKGMLDAISNQLNKIGSVKVTDPMTGRTIELGTKDIKAVVLDSWFSKDQTVLQFPTTVDKAFKPGAEAGATPQGGAGGTVRDWAGKVAGRAGEIGEDILSPTGPFSPAGVIRGSMATMGLPQFAPQNPFGAGQAMAPTMDLGTKMLLMMYNSGMMPKDPMTGLPLIPQQAPPFTPKGPPTPPDIRQPNLPTMWDTNR